MNLHKSFKILAIILFLVGAGIAAKGGYIHAKAIVAQILLKHAWQKTLAGETEVKPWPWADTWPIARLIVPGHDIDLIVLEGDTGNVLAFGPGRMLWSALPGQNDGNTIISGHRDTSFRFLEYVSIGESLLLETQEGKRFKYVVGDLSIQEADSIALEIASQIPTLTLITCYPFNGIRNSTSRYLILAELAEV